MEDSPSGAKPKPYKMESLPGGDLPEVGTLFNETLAEFTDNLGPYALAGLGQLVVFVPVVIVSVIAFYVVFFAGWIGTVALTGILGAMLSSISEDLAGLVMAFGSLGSMFVPLLLMIPVFLLMAAVLAPVQASLYRAVAAHQRGEKPLDFSSAFSTLTQNLSASITAAVVMTLLAAIALAMCYLPILLLPLFFGFTTTFAALHGLGGIQAARTSLQHALAHLNWHIIFALMAFVLGMFASYIPVVGPMFVLALHVRAYRYVFGDGAEPVLEPSPH